jgi:periplasmic protein CpxP/Spy
MFELNYGFLLARRLLLSASILLTSCCVVAAQTDSQSNAPANPPAAGQVYGHRHGVERQVKHLTHMLSLTPDQQTQVKAILAEQHQQMEQLRGSAPQSTQAGQPAQPDRDQIRSIRQDTNTKIEALLNDDQKTKFEAWIQQRQQRMQQRRGQEGQQTAPSNAPGA